MMTSKMKMSRRMFATAGPLALLGVQAAAADKPVTISDVKQAFQARNQSTRQMVQKALAAEGYYSGSIDGLWGASTESAFQSLMATDHYQKVSARWTWSHQARVSDTLLFLNSDAWME